MGLRAGGLLRRVGAVSVLTVGVSLFAIGMLPVQAAARHPKSAPTAPSCAHQANLNDPTNSTNKVLESYWFAIQHAGQTTTVCTLFGNVSAGDVVTAHFTLVPAPAAPATAAAPIFQFRVSRRNAAGDSVKLRPTSSSASPNWPLS